MNNIIYKGNGDFSVELPKGYTLAYNTISNVYCIRDTKGVEIKKRLFLTAMTLSEFVNLIKYDAEPTAEAHDKLQIKKEQFMCIGRVGKKWQILAEGSAAFCKSHQKRVKYAYDEVKTIYDFNWSNYES